jgi:RNA recognition motif-containing protein
MPWECTEEELVDLCKPFGRVVNTMCNVGANRNQAFVEFVSPCSLLNSPFLGSIAISVAICALFLL